MQSSSTCNAGIPNPLAKEESSLHHPYGERKWGFESIRWVYSSTKVNYMNSGMPSSILVERTRRLGSSQNDRHFSSSLLPRGKSLCILLRFGVQFWVEFWQPGHE